MMVLRYIAMFGLKLIRAHGFWSALVPPCQSWWASWAASRWFS